MKVKFSASALVKQSTAQTFHFLWKRLSRPKTERMIRGEEFQEKVQVDNYPEMRGAFEFDDFIIFFTWDEIVPKKDRYDFIEVKSVQDAYFEEWYVHSSLMQVAFYAAMSEETKSFHTAKFKINEGFERKSIYIDESLPRIYHLKFGPHGYAKVLPNKTLLNHYIDKASVITECVHHSNEGEVSYAYDLAREFDAEFKHKEWSIYGDTVHYTESSLFTPFEEPMSYTDYLMMSGK